MAQHFLEVGLPAAKIIIDINARDPRVLGTAFQGRDLFRHREGMFQQGFPMRKGEIIDDINEEEGHGGRIGGITM